MLDKEHVLVHLTMTIRNTGTVLLRLKEVRAFLYQVMPVDSETSQAMRERALIPEESGEADWPTCLKAYRIPLNPEEVRIEPGESDQQRFDFLLPADTKTVFAYTYVGNLAESQRELGWQLGQFYDLDEDPSEGRSSVESLTGKAATR